MTDAPTLDEAAYRAATAAFDKSQRACIGVVGAFDISQRAFLIAYLTATAKPQPVVVTDEMARDAKGVFERAFGTGEAMRTALEWFVRTHLPPSPAPQGMPEGLVKLFTDYPLPWQATTGGSVRAANDKVIIVGSTMSGLVLHLIEELNTAARPPEPKPEPFVPGFYWVRGPGDTRWHPLKLEQPIPDGWKIGPRIIEPSFLDSAKSGR